MPLQKLSVCIKMKIGEGGFVRGIGGEANLAIKASLLNSYS